MPSVSYTKAIDNFTGYSLTFVFLTLLEFVTVVYVNKKCSSEGELPDSNTRQAKVFKKFENVKFDVISRIAFPVGYLLFVIIYFCVYLIRADYQEI